MIAAATVFAMLAMLAAQVAALRLYHRRRRRGNAGMVVVRTAGEGVDGCARSSR